MSANFWRMRCAGHVINLVVQDFLIPAGEDEYLAQYDAQEATQEMTDQSTKERHNKMRGFGVLGKLHNIVVDIRSSPQRTKSFEAIAKRRVPLDNRTRWNSWWAMLDVALKLQSSLVEYLIANTDRIDKATK